MDPLLLALGAATLVVVLVAWRRARRRPPPDAPIEGGYTFLVLGNELRVMPGRLGLTKAPEASALVHGALHYRADRDGRADVGTFELDGQPYGLVGELEAAELEVATPEGSRPVWGIQGQFISPPEAPVVRERTVFVGTDDAELGRAIVAAFADDPDPEADAAIPWTLDGATRFAAKYLINRSLALSAEVISPGELELRYPDGSDGRVHLGNVFLNQMRDAPPTEALESLQRFLDSVHDVSAGIEREQLLPRVHRGTPPIVITARLATGEEVENELAAHAIGDDLSVIYVQDLPDSMRYLSPSDADALEPDPVERLALARANLARTMQRIRILGDGPIFMVVCGGNYEASLIQLPELWAVLDPLLDGPRLVAVPARDLLLVTGDAGEERRQQMQALANPDADLAYPISDGIYRWRPREASWERLDP